MIGGQVDKGTVLTLARRHGGARVEAIALSDIEAAMEVKSGRADYYLGACLTGGGGLAMAIALLGIERCVTVSSPGRPPKPEEIRKHVRAGKKAFGFTADHAEAAVPAIIQALLEVAE
ncbi:MAG: DUF2620 domain-containing protein [Firmicutes bacterium]|nr:DUF2620 domain-containing protein [Bacillota bacterium]